MIVKHFADGTSLTGALDLPGAEIDAVNGHVLVDGWLMPERGRIREVFLRAPGFPTLRVAHGVERLDVAEALGKPEARECGVRGTLVVPRSVSELFFELWVELESGERLCFETRSGRVQHRQAPGQAVLELADGTMLRASVETPGIGQVLEPGAWIEIKAWAWSNGVPIVDARLVDDHGHVTPLRAGGARPDVGDAFASVPGTDRCGLLGGFEVPHRPGPFEVELWVDLKNGERHRCLCRVAEIAAPAPSPERWLDRLRRRLLPPEPAAHVEQKVDLQRQWRETNRLTPKLQRELLSLAAELRDAPLISLLLPVHEASALRVLECVRSVLGQMHERWQLSIRDDGTSGPYLVWQLQRLVGGDPRVELVSNLARAATGEYVAMLDQDAVLAPDALLQIALRLRARPEADTVFTNEERAGELVFKGAYNPALGLPGGLTVTRRGRPRARVVHVPEVCYKRAAPLAPEGYWGARHGPLPVTVVIPTRDRIELLERCIESLRRTVPADALHLVVVDDESQDRETKAYLHALPRALRDCRVVRRPEPRTGFNFAKLVNFGASHVKTPAMLVLNNDIEALSPGWLEDLSSWLSEPNVAVVGAKLLYPNRTVEHAGVVVGPHSGLADHMFRGIPAGSGGYLNLANRARDVSAVTGACLLTSIDVYRELGGLDEATFAVDYNDVDYCLRVRASGRRVVYTPGAELIHAGGASRGAWYDCKEHLAFIERHGNYADPFVDPNIQIDSLTLDPNPHHFVHAERAPPRPRVLALADDDAFGEYLASLGCDVTLFDRAPAPNAGETLAQFRIRMRELAEREWRESFDVAIAHGPRAVWFLELVRTLGCPTLWHLPQRDDFEGTVRHFFPAWQAELARTLLAEKLGTVTRIVFPLDWSRSLYAAYDRHDTRRVLPLGISTRAIQRKPRSDDVVVAIADTRSDRGSVRRDVTTALGRAGANVSWFSLDESRAIPLAAGPHVRRHELLARADLLVIGETHAIHPRSLLEAMAFGVPVIGPGIPGVGDLIAHEVEGFILDMNDRPLVAKTVLRCIVDRDLRNKLGDNVAVKVRRVLDADRLAPRHLRLVKETLLAHSNS